MTSSLAHAFGLPARRAEEDAAFRDSRLEETAPRPVSPRADPRDVSHLARHRAPHPPAAYPPPRAPLSPRIMRDARGVVMKRRGPPNVLDPRPPASCAPPPPRLAVPIQLDENAGPMRRRRAQRPASPRDSLSRRLRLRLDDAEEAADSAGDPAGDPPRPPSRRLRSRTCRVPPSPPPRSSPRPSSRPPPRRAASRRFRRATSVSLRRWAPGLSAASTSRRTSSRTPLSRSRR